MSSDRVAPVAGRLILVLSTLPLVSALGCVGDQSGDHAELGTARTDAGGLDGASTTPPVAAMIDEPASFQFYRLDEGWGPCQDSTPGACNKHVIVARDGSVEGADRGAVFAGRLTAAELDAFVALVIGQPVLDELLDDRPCVGIPDIADGVTIGLAPGLRLVQITTSCGEGPIATMNAAARAVGQRFAGRASTPPATAPIAPSVAGGRVRFQPQLRYFERTWAPAGCARGAACESKMSIDVQGEHASLRRDGQTRTWLGVEDFAPLKALAVSPAVLEVLRSPTPCPDAGGARDHWSIGISAAGITVEADVAGCVDGPIASLRAAATALFDRLSASTDPSPDASASADHPADLARPAPDGGPPDGRD